MVSFPRWRLRLRKGRKVSEMVTMICEGRVEVDVLDEFCKGAGGSTDADVNVLEKG